MDGLIALELFPHRSMVTQIRRSAMKAEVFGLGLSALGGVPVSGTPDGCD
jgi:hypothetical protein